MPKFRLDATYSPTADQPKAIREISAALDGGERFTTLLGATGTGKTMTMAGVIEQVQRPTLLIAHNKTLAAQLCNEFRTYFPDNAVEYFVSYYDYYQPEAYVPSRDLYIEKDSAINQEVDRLRHAATAALFARRDVVIVASVSAIFGLGSPETYDANVQILKRGDFVNRDELLHKLVSLQYTRNDAALGRANFRVRGETLEVFPAYAESAYRAIMFGDEVERLQHFDPLTGEIIEDDMEHVAVWPATHYNVKEGTIERAVEEIGRELNARCAELEAEGKLLESHRLRQRTQYDMEMLREMGFCNGIENYSRILDGRPPGSRPYCLIDYFPDDFLCFIDESHQTVPQIGGMYEGDRSRKTTLVDYGFRLPSAMDNRPQTFDEFLKITPQLLFVSATPGDFERNHSNRIVEQIVRPTGIVDPEVEVRETRNQIDDLMNEVRKVVERDERILVTTLTKKMSEDLTDYLLEMGFKVRYLHSEIDTLERIQIIRDLRLGEYDVLVGVNLLREGLDLPEVGLVAILDADKEGFLRGETSLIQTIGRAARNVQGRVVMYADRETAAMRAAISRTDRRREIQVAYNAEHGITPLSIVKGISDIAEFLQSESKVPKKGRRTRTHGKKKGEPMTLSELEQTIVELEEEMAAAAEDLRFEYAARIRDEIRDLQREIREAREHGGPGLIDALLGWYAREARDLPWRRTRDPYRILVSEVMLQQTQVARVVPRYEAWIERWPTAEALAAAPLADVLREWVGLGYNRRAVRLHVAARHVAAHGWPAPERLTDLPGVGAYTAAAVGSFAFDHQVVALDVNAKRVFARAGALVPPAGEAALFNQATMELGARVCTARRPRCGVCPLRGGCPSRDRVAVPERRAAGARPRFEDTDRYVRGRVVAALAAGDPLPAGFAADRLARALDGLERDGLVVVDGGAVGLPGASDDGAR